jgi:hypothetical protein
MQRLQDILVTREDVVRAGGVRAAVEEALSLAALRMNPPAMTAYEAAGMTAESAATLTVVVEVESEAELREALAAGADGVRFRSSL